MQVGKPRDHVMCQSVEGFEDFVLLVVVTLVFPQTIFGHLHIFFLLEGALIAKAVLMCVCIYIILYTCHLSQGFELEMMMIMMTMMMQNCCHCS